MGCFLLLLVLANPRHGSVGDWQGTDTNRLLATIIGNHNVSAYIMAESHSRQNGVMYEPLELPHRPRALAGQGALSAANTNSSSPSK